MKYGRHEKKSDKRAFVAIVALVLVLCLTVGGTVAFLVTRTNSVTNTFTPSKVTTQVVETLDGNTKSDVMIKNTGDTSAYIRATYVVNWVDGDGNVYAAQPEEGTAYTVVLNKGSGSDQWTQGTDGYYYYNSEVPATAGHDYTGVLITSIAPVAGKAPTGYTLQVTIIAEGIQSTGMGETVTTAQAAFAKAAE